MENYVIRKATMADIPFLSKTVMEAEKSGTGKFSFSTLFNKTEAEALALIAEMFEEEIEGCELSINSFLVVEYLGMPVAAFSGWIEQLEGTTNSGLLKSNLIGYTFGKESISFLMTKAHWVKDIQIEREANCLQLEYLFVTKEHRGKKLANLLINKHIEEALQQFPALQKVQVQVFKNNVAAQKVYENCGFSLTQKAKSMNPEILNHLPSDEKYLMEKTIDKQ